MGTKVKGHCTVKAEPATEQGSVGVAHLDVCPVARLCAGEGALLRGGRGGRDEARPTTAITVGSLVLRRPSGDWLGDIGAVGGGRVDLAGGGGVGVWAC